MNDTMTDFLDKIESTYRDKIAFIIPRDDVVEEITYGEFVEAVIRRAQWIIDNGYKGKKVGIYGKNSYEWAVWFYGVTRASGIVVPIASLESYDFALSAIDRFDIELLLYDGLKKGILELGQSTSNSVKMLEMGTIDLPLDHKVDVVIDEMATSYIFMTSGTTGEQKGVALSQKAQFSFTDVYDHMDLPEFTTMTILPFHHVAGIQNITISLYSGNTCIISESLKTFMADVKRFKPNLIIGVPSILMLVLKQLERSRASGEKDGVSIFFCAGAPMQEDIKKKACELNIVIWEAYGLTETFGITSLNLGEDETGSVGRVLPYNQVTIEDGEIVVEGQNVMLGYYNNEDETAKTMQNGRLYTGDLGFVNEKGYLYITGRKKNMIILSNGENVSPEVIESELLKCKAIDEVVVKGIDDKLCAQIYCQSGNEDECRNSIEVYVEAMNKRMSRYYRINMFSISQEPFEKNATGKIIRN